MFAGLTPTPTCTIIEVKFVLVNITSTQLITDRIVQSTIQSQTTYSVSAGYKICLCTCHLLQICIIVKCLFNEPAVTHVHIRINPDIYTYSTCTCTCSILRYHIKFIFVLITANLRMTSNLNIFEINISNNGLNISKSTDI